MKAIAIVSMIAVLGASAVDAGTKQGRITSILVNPDIPGLIYIKIDTAYLEPEPSCSAGVSGWDFVLSIATATGKSLYALALPAQASGASVAAGGAGA
jgi:hypothetical protein